jgi:DNA-binding CsgD family transcriptional regulator
MLGRTAAVRSRGGLATMGAVVEGPPVTRRECDALALVAAGATNSEISDSLGIRDESVETLLARAYSTLGVRGRAEAVAAAHDRGLLEGGLLESS